MTDGRFRLGVGSGEELNEHILGDVWPSVDIRLQMLEEAVEVTRRLWSGDLVTHQGPLSRRQRTALHVARAAARGARVGVRAPSDAGFDEIYVNQIGDDQAGFFRFWRDELQPRLG